MSDKPKLTKAQREALAIIGACEDAGVKLYVSHSEYADATVVDLRISTQVWDELYSASLANLGFGDQTLTAAGKAALETPNADR